MLNPSVLWKCEIDLKTKWNERYLRWGFWWFRTVLLRSLQLWSHHRPEIAKSQRRRQPFFFTKPSWNFFRFSNSHFSSFWSSISNWIGKWRKAIFSQNRKNFFCFSVSDVFVLLPASEVRALRESAPSNLATLCYKAVERLVTAADTGAATHQEQQAG